jgi:hypothetical protein
MPVAAIFDVAAFFVVDGLEVAVYILHATGIIGGCG